MQKVIGRLESALLKQRGNVDNIFTDKQMEYLKSRKVIICTLFYMSQGFSQYFGCLLNTMRVLDKIGVVCDFMQINGASYVDHGRNVAVNNFLFQYPEYTDLVFIDSDMEWDVIGFLRLLVSKHDLVGSAYPMKNCWNNYSVRHYTNADMTPKVTEDGLIEAQYVPGGFLKITKNCLLKMIDEYKGEKTYNNTNDEKTPLVSLFECVVDKEQGVRYGEDTEFCRKWIKMGNKIYCEPRVTFFHYGVNAWSGNYHEHLINQPKPRENYGK